MATGIKILNDYGTILIDDFAPTLCVLAQGTSTIGSDGMAYIGNHGGAVAVRSTSIVGVQYFGAVDGYSAGYFLFGPPGASVQWWVYAQPQGAASNFGLKIWNDAGQLMFDAGKKAARTSVLRVGNSLPEWTGAIGLDGSRAWAILAMVPAYVSRVSFQRWGDPSEYLQHEDYSVAGGSVNGGTVDFAMTQSRRRTYGPYFGTIPPGRSVVTSNRATLAVLDVTGY
ncbi:hypothetical protein [uncultured Stenotrophomonas sp.]|uniref:hypothetical protein n=1 Tax=uncultured Stenotrophomonas sp. TaxID=165438 RepID=UPI0025F75C13|nr:hypothetical protein [uncultured Stenotrophomonas sp.]